MVGPVCTRSGLTSQAYIHTPAVVDGAAEAGWCSRLSCFHKVCPWRQPQLHSHVKWNELISQRLLMATLRPLALLLVTAEDSYHLETCPTLGRALHNMPLRLNPVQLWVHSALSYEMVRKPTWWLRRPPTFLEASLEDAKGLKRKHSARGQHLGQRHNSPALCFRELEEVTPVPTLTEPS